MKQIGDLFAKYKHTLKPPQATVERESVLVISQVVGINLSPTQLSYTTSTRILKVNAPGIIRSEVLRHKEDILNKLRQTLGVKNSPHTLI